MPTMTEDNRYPTLAQRFQQAVASPRSNTGTPSPPPRSPAGLIGSHSHDAQYGGGQPGGPSQNLTTKFQQYQTASSNGFQSPGPSTAQHHQQQQQQQQQSQANADPNSKAELARALDERYSRSREMAKQGMHIQSQMQTQSGRGPTAANQSAGLTGPMQQSAMEAKVQRKDGPSVEQRMTEDAIDDEATKQLWSSLDMTNVGLVQLSPTLFSYAFLTQLHLSNNHLTRLPAAIGDLRLLTHLDVSQNQITALPLELSMLSFLRELLAFDNKITAIPPEFGSLYHLEFLGLEGNPVSEAVKGMLASDGTTAFIHFLRDSCPVPMPPPDREWHVIPDGRDGGESFTVFNYNILAERYATATLYGYTPSWALAWEYRRELIFHEITSYNADLICLQEVDKENYDNFFAPELAKKGYEGVWWPKSRARTMNEAEQKTVDGCASFYKTELFELVNKQLIEFNQVPSFRRDPNFKYTKEIYNRFMTKDNIAVVAMLERKGTGSRLMLTNVHVFWDPRFRDVKVLQCAMLMDELQTMANGFARNPPRTVPKDKAPKFASGADIPIIICGDFNSIPHSGVYDFISQGFIEKDHEDFMNMDYGNYLKDGRRHPFTLRSAYARIGELSFTNHTPGFHGAIDYIWHSSNNLEVVGLLKDVHKSYLDNVVGFPNAHFPSDHICILAEFKLKPAAQVVRPDFGYANDSDKTSRPGSK